MPQRTSIARPSVRAKWRGGASAFVTPPSVKRTAAEGNRDVQRATNSRARERRQAEARTGNVNMGTSVSAWYAAKPSFGFVSLSVSAALTPLGASTPKQTARLVMAPPNTKIVKTAARPIEQKATGVGFGCAGVGG